MNALIQSEGFTVSTASRTYKFKVIAAPGEHRLFTVDLPLELFKATPLRFQDGPLIALERLKQELARETGETQAEAHLNIGNTDVAQYLEKHYPPKAFTWAKVPKIGDDDTW